MSESVTKRFDVLVVGGGPAGMAAAVSAAQAGVRVGVVDDNAGLGGQIWRGEHANSNSEASGWIRKASTSGIELIAGVRVVDQPRAGVLRGESLAGPLDFTYRKLILATGARERFLPFPGWTLPNVMGAGGLQSLVKCGLPVAGKRVIVAGTGPLLLAVAAFLREAGAWVLFVLEQASRMSFSRFATRLLWHPRKISQALSLRKSLSGVPRLTSAWPVAAEGNGVLQSVTISHRGRRKKVDCDYLACGFHLVPNSELPSLLGCRVRDGWVLVDDWQRTSQEQIFCAGEPTGVGGVELALIEGQIAGFAAVGDQEGAKKLFRPRAKQRAFSTALNRTFALRPELRDLPQSQTIVCRCEDVPLERLSGLRSWREAKLQTRCGMGPCQGRVCGSAAEFLFGWTVDSVRPPVFPAQLSTLSQNVRELDPVVAMRGEQ